MSEATENLYSYYSPSPRHPNSTIESPSRSNPHASQASKKISLFGDMTSTQTFDSRDTTRMEEAKHDLGLTEDQLDEASPSFMDVAYTKTKNGQVNQKELGGGPIPFNELKKIKKQMNKEKEAEFLKNKRKNKKKAGCFAFCS